MNHVVELLFMNVSLKKLKAEAFSETEFFDKLKPEVCSRRVASGYAEESPNFTGQGAGRESRDSSPGMTAQAGYHR